MDKLTSEQRRKIMRAVKNKDSKIELALRKELHRRGYRYRKNYKKLFGQPDVVFTKEKIAIFCDSEFWHGHDWDNRKFDFKSKQEFWYPKIERNIERDKEVTAYLEAEGYVVLRFWGNKIKDNLDEVICEIEENIHSRRDKLH